MNKKIMVLGIILLFLVGIFSGCINESLDNTPDNTPENKSNIIYVDINGDGDFISIQDAINASNESNIIFVRSGTYYEKLNINKSINLFGEGKNSTIISMRYTNNLDHLIFLEANDSSIQYFTFNSSSNSLYDGILLTRSTNITIKNNNIIGFNHGIYIVSFSEKNTISDNFISNNNYGIRIKGGDYNNVSKNTIKNNNRGVYCCCGAVFNEIHFNNFFENYEYNGVESSSLSNYWDSNYWDDYNGTDLDDDGFGDTPYDIPVGNSKDSKPLINPFEYIL
jgi:parallel beta-helix repeat protein